MSSWRTSIKGSQVAYLHSTTDTLSQGSQTQWYQKTSGTLTIIHVSQIIFYLHVNKLVVYLWLNWVGRRYNVTPEQEVISGQDSQWPRITTQRTFSVWSTLHTYKGVFWLVIVVSYMWGPQEEQKTFMTSVSLEVWVVSPFPFPVLGSGQTHTSGFARWQSSKITKTNQHDILTTPGANS